MEYEPAYQEALDYLYSFVDYSLKRATRYSPEQFDLGRMRVFMEHLGQPQQAYPIIHVAGTKGKGSVSAMCASALRAAGYRVGLYTSPHMQDYAERFQVDGQPISHADVIAIVEEIKPYLDRGTKLTTFEISTALAFLYFARQEVTAAVFEVGLGGRLDATNVVSPVVSVITSISYDHTAFLGETLAEIAAEKAGIIKPDVPLVLAPQQEEARLVIERIAAERGAPLIQVGRDYLFTPVSGTLEGQVFKVWPAPEDDLGDSPVELTIPLLGNHQVDNAATAYAVLQETNDRGLPIDEPSIRDGFANVVWPARFEILQENPPVVIDSAHNRDSASKLRQALDEYFANWPVILVFGASEDKDIEGMFAELISRVQQVIVTRSYHPRGSEPDDLYEVAKQFGRPTKIVPAIEEALDEALRLAGKSAMILVTGSIFIAAGARDTWYNHLKMSDGSVRS